LRTLAGLSVSRAGGDISVVGVVRMPGRTNSFCQVSGSGFASGRAALEPQRSSVAIATGA